MAFSKLWKKEPETSELTCLQTSFSLCVWYWRQCVLLSWLLDVLVKPGLGFWLHIPSLFHESHGLYCTLLCSAFVYNFSTLGIISTSCCCKQSCLECSWTLVCFSDFFRAYLKEQRWSLIYCLVLCPDPVCSPDCPPCINGSGEERAVTRDCGRGCGYKRGPGLLWENRCCAVQFYVNSKQQAYIL